MLREQREVPRKLLAVVVAQDLQVRVSQLEAPPDALAQPLVEAVIVQREGADHKLDAPARDAGGLVRNLAELRVLRAELRAPGQQPRHRRHLVGTRRWRRLRPQHLLHRLAAPVHLLILTRHCRRVGDQQHAHAPRAVRHRLRSGHLQPRLAEPLRYLGRARLYALRRREEAPSRSRVGHAEAARRRLVREVVQEHRPQEAAA